MKLEIWNWTAYLWDCLEVMKTIPDNNYDLAIVDPPYGIGEDGSKNHSRGKCAKGKNYKAFAGNDLCAPSIEYFNELRRISKNQIIFGANHFISKIPIDSSCWFVWDKDNGGSDFADCELAWTSFNTAVRRLKYRWAGMLQQNMKNKEFRIHPTQKPVDVYRWLLKNYAKDGDKIFDSHGGSFSSAIACDMEGYDLDICELDKYYFDAAVQRFNMYKSQLTLF